MRPLYALPAQESCSSSVTHAVVNPPSVDPDALLKQELAEIPTRETQVKEQGLPFEPHARLTDEYLQWERDETAGFLDKELRKDPRLQPSDVVVNTDHMSECMLCKQERAVRANLHHAPAAIRVGTERQPFFDDWPIESFSNAIRFLNPPSERRDTGIPNQRRSKYFGCPCSAYPSADGAAATRAVL